MDGIDLLERVAFRRVGLMDVDHLRDVAYEALESGVDSHEIRAIAGDAGVRLDASENRARRAVAVEELLALAKAGPP